MLFEICGVECGECLENRAEEQGKSNDARHAVKSALRHNRQFALDAEQVRFPNGLRKAELPE